MTDKGPRGVHDACHRRPQHRGGNDQRQPDDSKEGDSRRKPARHVRIIGLRPKAKGQRAGPGIRLGAVSGRVRATRRVHESFDLLPQRRQSTPPLPPPSRSQSELPPSAASGVLHQTRAPSKDVGCTKPLNDGQSPLQYSTASTTTIFEFDIQVRAVHRAETAWRVDGSEQRDLTISPRHEGRETTAALACLTAEQAMCRVESLAFQRGSGC